MKYSRMSLEQRKLLLEDPESYPLRVTFLGKTGIITEEQVAFLLENHVDFDVDDRQAAEVLGPEAVQRAAAAEHPRRAALYLLLVLADAILVAAMSLFRRLPRR